MPAEPLQRALFLVMISGLFTGCAETLRFSTGTPANFERRCVPPTTELRMVSLKDMPATAKHEKQSEKEVAVPMTFSQRSLDIAEVIDASALLKHIAVLQAEKAQDRREIDVRLLKVRQELIGRVMLAMLEVSSLTAEAICEQERADRIADHLQEVQLHRVRQLTLAAVVIGGLTNIISGGLSLVAEESTAAGITSIVGGSLEALFGTSALFHETQHVFWHHRNLLQEVWDGPLKPTLFSGSVWRFLNRSSPENPQGGTLRDELIAGWKDESRLGKGETEKERRRAALILGDGGMYQTTDFRARTAMLETLHATINLMHEDLEQLVREVVLQQAILD